MENIKVCASDLWDYCKECEEELVGNMHMIAENEEYGIQIWVTLEDYTPVIVVEADGSEVYREDIITPKDAKRTANKIYEDYLSIKAIEKVAEIGDTSEEDDDLIAEREEEIDLSLREFINTVAETGCCCIEENVVDDLKEHFIEYMYRKWGIGIYRPMYLEDIDTGEEYFTEYPYDDMIFDDNNPIYNKSE